MLVCLDRGNESECKKGSGELRACELASPQTPDPDRRPPRKWCRRPVMVGAIALTMGVMVSAASVALDRGKDGGSQFRDLVQRFVTSVEAGPFEAAAMPSPSDADRCRNQR